MKQLYVNGHFLHQQLTGVQRYAYEILAGFDKGGYSYKVLGPNSFFAGNKIGHHIWEQLLLPLKHDEEAVLWSPTNTGPVYASNHVITLHDAAVYVHPEWFSKNYVRWRRVLIPRLMARAKTILTVSEYSKSIICSHLNLPAEKVKVVYNGIDIERFQPADRKSIARVREKYNLPVTYLLTLGSLDPRKNFWRLIKAWEKYAGNSDNPYTLAIAGGANANFRQSGIDDSASVRLLGYVDDKDLPALYSGALGFLFPSLFEGFGLPVLEAMACGTPVLTSNTTALNEVAGEAAIRVSPESVEAIYEGLIELLDSPGRLQSLTEKGFQRTQLFDWNKSAAAIYKHLVQ